MGEGQHVDPGQRINELVAEIQSASREHSGMIEESGPGRCTWVSLRMDDVEADTARVVTITMSVDGVGTIGEPWDEHIAGAMGRMLNSFAIPPDDINAGRAGE